MENWYLPIMMLPGIALLILSTSSLMVALSNEINEYLGDKAENHEIMFRKLAQLKLLNTTMVLFYISVAFIVSSGLFSGLSKVLSFENKTIDYIIIIGVVIFLSGLICLISYSYKAIIIRQDQFLIEINKKDN